MKRCLQCGQAAGGERALCDACLAAPQRPLPAADRSADLAGARRSAFAWWACSLSGVAFLVALVALPGLIESPAQEAEREAVRTLADLLVAELRFREQDPDGDGVADFGSLEELGQFGLIDAELAAGRSPSFAYELIATVDSWTVVANPAGAPPPGARAYMANHEGRIVRSWDVPLALPPDGRLPEGLSEVPR